MATSEKRTGLKRSQAGRARRAARATQASRPMSPWTAEVESVLISAARLRRRVGELARQITADYRGRELVIVAVLDGTILFLADLIRLLDGPMRLDFVGVSSYREGTASRELVLTRNSRLDVCGRDVLIIDDILDTGRTLLAVKRRLRAMRPRELRTCVLLDKPARRVARVEADYVGFTIPNVFVVGYGLDYAERFRNLPYVGVLRPPERQG